MCVYIVRMCVLCKPFRCSNDFSLTNHRFGSAELLEEIGQRLASVHRGILLHLLFLLITVSQNVLLFQPGLAIAGQEAALLVCVLA